MRIPATQRFPFGYVVRIRQVTDTEMANESDEDIADIPDGLWDSDERIIWIRKALSPRRKRYVLLHELGHALLDCGHACMNENKAKP